MDLMARLGVGLMVIAQKPWETVEEELAAYRERFVELNGDEPPKPILCVFVGVSHDPAEAAADARRLPAALRPLDRRALPLRRRRLRRHRGLRVLRRSGQATSRSTAWRSSTASSPTCRCGARPTQVTDKLLDYVERTDAGAVLTTLSYGGMPPEVARPTTTCSPARCCPPCTPTTSAATSACGTSTPPPPSVRQRRPAPKCERSVPISARWAWRWRRSSKARPAGGARLAIWSPRFSTSRTWVTRFAR